LHLDSNYTFTASNFPVSPAIGQVSNISGVGTWELQPSYAAFLVKFTVDSTQYPFRVIGWRGPFVLASSINDDDESLKARRLEDDGK
jgi:hypothetical protein